MSDWDGVERKESTDRTQFKEAVVEAATEFWADEKRVQAIVALVLQCLSKEIESGAGRALFRGFSGFIRKALWLSLVLMLLFYFGGPQAVITFFKGMFTS